MAGVRWSIVLDDFTSSTSADLTAIQILAGAPRDHIDRITITGKGTSGGDTPVNFQLALQTSAGTGSSSQTVNKVNQSDDESLQLTALKGFSAEPTTSTVFHSRKVHPQGSVEINFPYGRPFSIKGATRLGLVQKQAVQASVFTITIEGEE